MADTEQDRTGENPELKPCPFCGGDVAKGFLEGEFECQECDAYFHIWFGEDGATEAFNCRTPDPRIAKLEAALRDIADSDDVDNALDPERNKRVARAALNTGRDGE